MTDPQHLVKLAVGCAALADLVARQGRLLRTAEDGTSIVPHLTRNAPKRVTEVLSGGSIYWIIKGRIVARNRILGIRKFKTDDGKPRCCLSLSPDLVETYTRPFRPFQGWRYLEASKTPDDKPYKMDEPENGGRGMAEDLKVLGLL